MKKLLFFLFFCCIAFTGLQAQTITWTGAVDVNYNNPNNWNPAQVPTAANDVIIPTGSTMTINVAASVKSIKVQGTSTVTINNNLQFTHTSSFSSNTTVYWNNGSLYGGGTLTNNGTVNLTTGGSRYISGPTTINNNGLFTMPAGGYLYLYDTSVFNNTVSGTFDIQSDATLSYNGADHSFINAGLFKKSAGSGTSLIYPIFTNTGTIAVESGTMDMYYHAKYFDGGVYNVAEDAVLQVSTNGMNISGTLTGNLDGPLYWTGNFTVPDTATFDFTGDAGVSWASGSLIGGGTLTNESTINLVTGASRYISGGTTLENIGMFTMPAGGYLYLYDTSVFNNTVSGTFDLQSDAWVSYNGSEHSFINAGLFKKSAGSGISLIYPIFTNTGTIAVESGTMDMYYHAKYFDGGVYNVAEDAVLQVSTNGMNISGTLTGNLDGPLYWTGNFTVPDTATFDFTGDAGVSWASGSLIGGGTLTNESTINLVTGASRYISGGTTLENIGMFTMPAGGYLYLYDASVFNNTVSGTFDLQSDATLSYNGADHSFINAGLFKKSAGSGTSLIQPILTNTGTIAVESGSMDMYYHAKYFNGGVYNVSAGSSLICSASGMNISGTLTGTLDGPLVWTGNFSVATTATFDFAGTSGVNWNSGYLFGGGILTNASTLNLSTAGSRYISGTVTTLANTGTINFPDGGYLFLYNDTTLDNKTTGVIDFQSNAIISYNGSGAFKITNAGTITKSEGTGVTYIYPPVTNSGTINVLSGELEFADNFGLNNTIDGVIKGTATIDLPSPANFTNDGTFAPGGSPGMLTVLGTYISTSSSVLDVEINGLAAGTEYDQLVITGTNAVFEGTVNVDLGFEANIGDSFTIATVSGTIATKNLASPVFTVYGCREYTFSVSYPADKSVVLTVTNKGEVQPPQVETQNITVQLDVNGEVSIIPEQIDNGSGAGCAEGGELTFSLDQTDFTCADIGNNTVVLTVTDENGNSASGTAIVTVEDDMAPSAMAQNITVNLNASGSATIAASDIDSGSTDNCSIASRNLDITTFGCANIGTNTVTLTVIDSSGNSATATATVTITDTLGACNEAPVAVCLALTMDANADCQGEATARDFDGGSYDPNGNPLTFTLTPIGPFGEGTTEVTLTVSNGTDSDSCTTTITVVDNTPPVANCAAPFTVELDASGNASISVSDIDNGSSDYCGIMSTSIDVTDFSCGNIGENTVTLTVVDIGGNISTCSTVVTVTDPLGSCNEAPIAVCQAVTVSADFNCWGNATAQDFDGGSTDPNGAPLTFSVDPVGPYIVGTTNVTLTVSNGTSSANCTTTITVVDDTPPVASCSPFTVQLDANGTASITETDIDNGSSDNCGLADISIDITDFDCTNVGENTVTLTVTDLSGNISTCTTVVTVEDNLAPIVSTQDITVQLDASGNASISPSEIDNGSSDNCEIASIAIDRENFSCSDIGSVTVTLTVTDTQGNSSSATAMVTVEDPMGSCSTADCGEENPNDFTFETGLNCTDASAFKNANDITIAANEKFTLEKITASFFSLAPISNINVNYYADDTTGLPGTLIGQQASVNIVDQTIIGQKDGYDIYEVEMSVDPFPFVGQVGLPTTYWIELSVTTAIDSGVFWVVTSSSMIGNPSALYENEWTYYFPDKDGVYKWEGTCEPLDGTICLAPGDLTVDMVTAYSAEVTWTPNGSESNWIVQYGDSGFDPNSEGTAVSVSGTPNTVLSPLSPNTSYDVYVKADCGAEQSNFVGPVSFMTNPDSSMAPFITTWKTTASNETITIPTTGGGYNYSVDWGDGTSISGYNGNASHTYATAGTYTVSISGDFPRIYFNNSGDRLKIQSIEQWGNIQWSSMNSAFMGAENLVSHATDMPDLSMVSDMYGMFAYARKFNGDANFGNWNVGNVTNMTGMFGGASLFNYPIGGWNVGNVTSMEQMFHGATIFNQNLNSWNVGSVTTMKNMFATAMDFNQDIGNWDVGNVTTMNSMFSHANSFDQNIGGWNVANVTNMANMFRNVTLSTANYDALLNGWNSLPLKSNVKFSGGNSKYCSGKAARDNMIATYGWTITDGGQLCLSTDQFITTWKTTAANESISIPTTGSGYYYSVDWGDGSSATGITGNISHSYAAAGVYTVKISGAFPRIYFNNGGDRLKIMSIEQWGSNVWSSMNGAFMGCENLVGHATDMPDLSQVTDMYGMFAFARKFNGDANFGNWNVGNVTDMTGMFAGASVFNHPIGNWNVGNVANMEQMFRGATLFNQNIGGWNVGNVTNMKDMLNTAMRFNQDIGNWNVGKVTNMNAMFFHANSFDQDLGSWNVSNVTNMANMFRNVTLSTANYDSLLSGWSTLPLKSNVKFHAGFSKYCAGEPGRLVMTGTFHWTITDGGKDCGVYNARLDVGGNAPLFGVALYPNPMKDELAMDNPKNVILESISIFDLTGRLVQKVELNGMTTGTVIDVSRLSSATYMVIVNGKNGKTTELMIKE